MLSKKLNIRRGIYHSPFLETEKNKEKRYEKLMKLLGGCTGHPYLKFKLGFGGKTLQVSWLKGLWFGYFVWFKIQVMQNHLKVLLINAICVIWPDFSSFRVFKPRAIRSTNFMRFKSTRKSIDEVWAVLFSYSARQCSVPTQPSIKSDWTIDSIIWNFNWNFMLTKNYPKRCQSEWMVHNTKIYLHKSQLRWTNGKTVRSLFIRNF